MESGEITSSSIFVGSSNYVKSGPPWSARLNGKSAWIPKQDRGVMMITIYFRTRTRHGKEVTSIATQGHPDKDQWVTEYRIEYETRSFRTVHYGGDNKVFKGNTDRNSVVKNVLNPPIRSTSIMFVIKSWHKWPVLRMELYGCSGN